MPALQEVLAQANAWLLEPLVVLRWGVCERWAGVVRDLAPYVWECSPAGTLAVD